MAADDPCVPVAPIPVSEVARFDAEADVVVVGLGCAGACAATEAAEAGADVLVLEAATAGGGTSANSGGLIYLGGGTPVQEACGFADDADNMARFLTAACGPGVDPAKVTDYCADSVGHFHWLVDHGVPFDASYHPEHDREPPDTSGLVYSGGEDAWPFTDVATPAPRGHHPAHPDSAGGFLMQRLLAAVDRSGARVAPEANARRLVTDSEAVVGIEATIDGERRVIRARRGVVLTAGGFTFNRAMVEQHCPAVLRCNFPIGTEHDDGRAIRMGLGVGATVTAMDRIEVGIPLTPPRTTLRGIIVNGRGERFMNEDTYAGRLGQEFLLRQDGRVFFVHSDETFAVNIVGYTPRWVAETAAELEAEIVFPPGSLQATLDRYNAHAARGEDPDHHKAADLVVPLEPPYGVVDLGVDRAYFATFTLGGLDTTPDGEAAPGLYAAGRTTAGIARGGYVSGISLGDGTYFGRRAGRSAARRILT
ncbi:MAG: FAD-dependent oxidoreductase [Actinomycetota bacterium]